MSAVADWIDENIGVIPIVSDIAHIFGNWVDAELEFVMGLFGIEAEDIITTNVASQRMLEDTPLSKLITKAAIEEMREPGIGILDRLMAYSHTARGMYGKYYNYGKTTFLDGLPETNIKSLFVDNVIVKSIIDAKYGINSTILSSKLSTTTKEAFVGYMLQEAYGYKPFTNLLTYNGYTYSVSSIDYNYNNDNYDVSIKSVEDQTTTEYTTTTVTVTNIDTTTDNKNTIVTKRTTVVGSVQGSISDVTVEISNADEVVPINTVVNSTSTTTDSSTVHNVTWSTAVLQIVAYSAVRYYTVQYWYVDDGEWYWWVYKDGSGEYPQLDAVQKYINNLDMLPVITIRNAGTNVNVDKNSDRYKQSSAILKYIGLDIETITDSISQNADIDQIQDCFIHFGIRPTDTANVVSKALYALFDYMYEDSSLNTDGSFVATTSEGPFNAALKWATQSRTVVDGVIGHLNYIDHTASGTTLTVRKQVTPEQYVVYEMTDVASATFINRDGMSGSVDLKMSDPNFSIPLSYFFVKKLSIFDQYELFSKTLTISMYAASIQHLEWYETEAFGALLKIVGLVLSIISFGAYAAVYGLVAALTMTAVVTIIMIGATMLLKMIMESTDSEFIKGLAAVVFIAAMVYGGGMGSTLDAGQLTQMVSTFATTMSATATAINTYTEVETEALQGNISVYTAKLNEAQNAIDAAKENLGESMLSMDDVAGIATMKISTGYIEGVDAMMYRAVGIQYAYDTLYDYDSMVGGYYDRAKLIGVV